MYAELNGLRMSYEDRGKSNPTETLVFLHGLPLDLSIWRYQLDYFSTDYRCLAPDLRGFGGTSDLAGHTPPAMLSIETFADDVVALLDHVGVKHAILVGLSMGGYIALAIWRRMAMRKRVHGLIFVDTRAAADSPETKALRKHQAQLIQTSGVTAYADEMIPRLLAPENIARCEREVRYMIERTKPEALVATIGALGTRKDMTPWLRRVVVPALAIVGDKDVISPVSDSQLIQREVSYKAQLVVIPNAGHLSPLEQPTAFNEAMFKSLK